MLRAMLRGAALVAILSGCDMLAPPVCTQIVRPALVVTVLDSLTASTVAGPVVVVARDGAFADTADLFNPYNRDPETMDFNPFPLAFERGGTYEVTVGASGYRLWRATGVKVKKGSCHVETVPLTAKVQRP
jgi:hypothetical protein